jgi:hypothetical protein
MVLLLGACRTSPTTPTPPQASGPCLDGGHRCAAALAEPGQRRVRRGHRIWAYGWTRRPNRESGGADLGLQADWQPTVEQD